MHCVSYHAMVLFVCVATYISYEDVCLYFIVIQVCIIRSLNYTWLKVLYAYHLI